MHQSTLRRLLDGNARFDLGNRGTVNHLPMALYALAQMGASDERLTEYFGWWEENRALPRGDTGRRIEADEWEQYIGEPTMFSALWEIFTRRGMDRGIDEVVGDVFPLVSGGIAAAAFHGLIRLAYGIEADHLGEIGAGLATICSRYANLGLPDHPPTAASVEEALARIAGRLSGSVFTGQGIIGKMLAATADPQFAGAFSVPSMGTTLLDDLARVAITLYWQTSNFTVLHMVTTTYAARVLFERYPQLASEDAIMSLWGAVCAAYASVGAPKLSEMSLPLSEPKPWREIFAAAVPNNNDHVIKMAFTCHRESIRHGNPLYQAAAARLVTVGKTE
jgi:hypothetical protein